MCQPGEDGLSQIRISFQAEMGLWGPGSVNFICERPTLQDTSQQQWESSSKPGVAGAIKDCCVCFARQDAKPSLLIGVSHSLGWPWLPSRAQCSWRTQIFFFVFFAPFQQSWAIGSRLVLEYFVVFSCSFAGTLSGLLFQNLPTSTKCRYVFVFNWTPALDSCSSGTPPHGLIFSAFMKPGGRCRILCAFFWVLRPT